MLDERSLYDFAGGGGTEPRETELEVLLRLATEDISRRPEFYRVLLDASVWVLVESSTATGRTMVPAGSNVYLINWPLENGDYVLPFFSSVARIYEATSDQYGSAAQMPVRELFEATRGQTLLLNPKCKYGCALEPREISMLLDTGTVGHMSTEITKEARQVVIEPGDDLSPATIKALNDLYHRTSIVRTAYRVRFHDPDALETYTLVIAIEADREDGTFLQDTATILRETSVQNEIVDLLLIHADDGGIGQYIVEQTKPFYRRDGARH